MAKFNERLVETTSRNQGRIFAFLLFAWWLSGLVTIFLPVRNWNRSRQAYYSVYGRYIEYELAQRQYQQQQQNRNNNNYNYNAQGYYNQNGQWVANKYMYNACRWFQVRCRRQQAKYQQWMQQYGRANNDQRDGQQQRQQMSFTPGWYQFLGGKTSFEGEERGDREEMNLSTNSSNGGVKFVYGWSLTLFILVLLYGTLAMWRHRQQIGGPHLTTLFMAVLGLFQSALLVLVLSAQGVIVTNDRELASSVYGWYGQWPILLVYFEYALLWFTGMTMVLLTLYGTVVAKAFSDYNRNNGVIPHTVDSTNKDSVHAGGYVGI